MAPAMRARTFFTARAILADTAHSFRLEKIVDAVEIALGIGTGVAQRRAIDELIFDADRRDAKIVPSILETSCPSR